MRKLFIYFILVISILFCSNHTNVWADTQGKWITTDEGIKYKQSDGSYVTACWKNIDGFRYRFNSKGFVRTGWITIGGKDYYLKKSKEAPYAGQVFTGWKTIQGKEYYFNFKTGALEPDKECLTVAIDAGHQQKGDLAKEPIGPNSKESKYKVTYGASGPWSHLAEYELNLAVATELEQQLLQRGYKVYMIRTTNDVNISNQKRAQLAAKANADIFIRIHANSSDSISTHGAMVVQPSMQNPYLSKKLIEQSRHLSDCVILSYCSSTKAKQLSNMDSDTMSGINWSTIPVSIIELGFMSNKAEDLQMATPNYQKKMAKGIADGIDTYFQKETTHD